MVPEDHLLASINGAYNAIHFTGDTVGNVLFYGQGAGMMPTGSAVAADVVDIARNIQSGSVGRVPALSYLPECICAKDITPIDDLFCPYYFRITAKDESGVLSKVSGILARNDISIESVIQKGRKEKGPVSIVMRTHTARESAVRKALDEIDSLDVVTVPTVKIRILAESNE
jgi:homoserine dehydrogenase